VHFRNGERQDLPVRNHIRPGQCTRALDFEGRDRGVRRVVLIYSSAPNFRGQAMVTLHGLR
jgi:hypothetical protein